ncbi:PREDICTED: pathogenesis-related protein PRB1-3-like [Nelumbo nucifera]|uniref:Pathogenesis-related protein PRB1-3-like n=1 Tax=Nelumbo nucifera TaxID=4432 RepID=A0A1U8Q6H5_NELNU|nr:PREDICTED: pathogenesis-related protein PRB1-3-like [Nelumbo nucifera]
MAKSMVSGGMMTALALLVSTSLLIPAIAKEHGNEGAIQMGIGGHEGPVRVGIGGGHEEPPNQEEQEPRNKHHFLEPDDIVLSALVQSTLPKHVESGRSERGEFLWAHNRVRAYMKEPLFTWDKKLARFARRFAAERVKDCLMIHSNNTELGENIFWGGTAVWTAVDVVRYWVNECMNYDSVTNQCHEGSLCGHYTQIVWRNSTQLGCALRHCDNGGMFAICNYYPSGNFVGESPFC